MYSISPTTGTFVFSAMLTKGHRLQWILNCTDANDYVLFQMDDNNFYRTEIKNGQKGDETKIPHTALQRAETLLVVLVRDFGLVPLLAVLDLRAVEVVVVHLEEHVVIGVGAIEDPLQAVTFGEHSGKNKRAGRGRDTVHHEVSAFTNERAFLLLPACRVFPLGHAARCKRQIQTSGLTSVDPHR